MTISNELNESDSVNPPAENETQPSDSENDLTETEDSEVGEIVDRIEQMPPESQKLVFKAVKSSFSGPLPHPEIMKGYEEVVPGAAQRILDMTEKRMDHRMNLETRDMDLAHKNLDKEFNLAKTSLIFGGIMGLILIIACIILVYQDKTIAGFSMLIPIVLALIVKKTMDNKKNQEPSTEAEESADTEAETE